MEKISINIKNGLKVITNRMILFNKGKIDRTLKIMSLKDKDYCFDKLCSPSEITNLGLMVDFLNRYNGNSVIEDFNVYYLSLSNLCFGKEFYIYFLKMFYRNEDSDNLVRLKNNIDNLFYGLEVECLFNEQKFRSHYKMCYLDDLLINNDLDEKLLNIIKESLPKENLSELELAIALYLILCRSVSYSGNYVISKKIDNVPKYYEVNDVNNEVICVTFAIIYYKLLRLYNIDANLSGDLLTHMKVELRINTMMLSADGTYYGFNQLNGGNYQISDLGNAKFGFSLTGFNLVDEYYSDLAYIKYNKDKLYNAILKVSKMMNLDNEGALKIGNILYNYEIELRRLKKNSESSLLDEIEYRIDTLNKIYSFKIEGLTCENKQFISKFKHRLFNGINLRDVLLYREIDGNVELYNLYVITLDGEVLYYLDDGNSFRRYEIEKLKEIINERQLLFKNDCDKEILSDSVLIYKRK